MPDDVSALQLVLSGDPALLAIVRLSLLVSLSAVVLAALIGVPLGACVALTRFPGREAVIVILNALMGLPPVVVGLAVYLLLSRSGPLGSWGLLFTPQAMIIAQTMLVTPIIAALTRQTIEDLWPEYRDELTAMDVGPFGRIATLIWDARFSLVTALLAGFGRAAAEVGAIIIVGGNIDGFTRTMTTAIALETSKGDLPLAIGLGMVLIAIVVAVNALAWGRAPRRRTTGGMTMRAPATDLPIVLDDVERCTRAASRSSSGFRSRSAPGAPTVLIGPNGSGKTTLLRVAMGLIGADRAAASPGAAAETCRRARAPSCSSVRRCFAAAPPANIRYALAAAGVPRAQRDARARRAAARSSASTGSAIARRAGCPAASSSGWRWPARSRDPQVLLLDEPTASLDPAATKAIEDIIRAVAARGIKVVMATHDLGEARRLAGDIVLLHRGRVHRTRPGRRLLSTHRKTEEARRFIAGELLV